MKKYSIILNLIAGLLLFNISFLAAQNTQKLAGKVLSPFDKQPMQGVVVSVPGTSESVQTDSLGEFTLQLPSLTGVLEVWAPEFYLSRTPIMGRSFIEVRLIPDDKANYNEVLLRPFKVDNIENKNMVMFNLSKAELPKGSLSVDGAIANAIPGLRLLRMSGMPGEGSYMNGRGLNTFIAKTSPLIIINNIPFFPDMEDSYTIGGFTNNIFEALNPNDIQNITYLTGADAAIYGSLGSNGVILIETDNATDLDTKVEFIGQYGVARNVQTLPAMGASDYKTYLGNIALSKYDDPADILAVFPFLKDDPNYYYNYLYKNNTDWQDLIYEDAFVTDNLLKIKGGDAIARYDFSLGYLNQSGVIKNTGFSRYHTRLNANINVSKKVEMFASASMAYLTNNLQEQGMSKETNPLLASLAKSPLLSPYEMDKYGNQMPNHAGIRDVDGNILENNAVSNPVALVNTTDFTSQAYDVLMSIGLNYKLHPELTLTGSFGFYYNYNRMEAFIPGAAIMPLSEGLAENTARMGINESTNLYYNLGGKWMKKINKIHDLNATFGWQAKITKREYDSGEGRNSASDFYKTLSDVNTVGRSFYGYINLWNWMNFYGRAEYTYNNLLSAGVNMSYDGSSSSGNNASRFYLYNGINAAWNIKNMPGLIDSRYVDKLKLRAEYTVTGNSEFSSLLSRYYYQNQQFQQLSGIVREGIPNTFLKPEKTSSLNLGIDFSGLNNFIDLTIDVYSNESSDVIMKKKISSVFGKNYTYDNMATITNKGIEIGAQAYLVKSKTFQFLMGGTIAFNKNELTGLSGESDVIVEMPDGSALISRVGESLYSFYGYKTDGVFSTTAEAEASGLTNYAGTAFQAGDVRFVNVNGSDNVIDEKDRVILGDANPDFFGRFYVSAGYKNFMLTANFIYSYGNEAYNAVRREFESMSSFDNQLQSVNRRWQNQGQITDMPRAVFGDPMKNSRFSDRWIEDASFCRLKEVTLSYSFGNKFIPYINGGTFYVSGEDLALFTKYLGLDPEFSYSYSSMLQGFDYGKIAHPATVKFGVKLQF